MIAIFGLELQWCPEISLGMSEFLFCSLFVISMFEENEYTRVQRLRSSNFFKNNYLQFKSWSSDINYSSFQPTAMQWSTVLWEFRAIKDCSFWGHRYASKHYKQRDMLWYLDFSNTCSTCSPKIPQISVFRVVFISR